MILKKKTITESMAEIYSRSDDDYVREKIISNSIRFFPRSYFYFMYACEQEKKPMQALDVMERLVFSRILSGKHAHEVYKTLHHKVGTTTDIAIKSRYIEIFLYVHHFLIKRDHIKVTVSEAKLRKMLAASGSGLALLVLAKMDFLQHPDRYFYANMLEVLAAKSYYPAMTELANTLRDIYYHGSDEDRALAKPEATRIFNLYADAVKIGNDPEACIQAGVCCETGFGTKMDKVKAYYYYQKAADQHYPAGIEHRGRCMRNGIGTDKADLGAFMFYNCAAKQGSRVALYFVGQCYEYGIGTEIDRKTAYAYYRKAIEGDSLDAAMHALSRCFRYGIGTDIDKNQVRNINRQISLHDISVDEDAAVFFSAGLPAAPDTPNEDDLYFTNRFRGLLSMANAPGIAKSLSQLEVAGCYEYAIGVKRDHKKAFQWYSTSADNGNIDALFALAHCYQHGVGTAINQEKSTITHKKASAMLRQNNEQKRFSIAEEGLKALIKGSNFPGLLAALTEAPNYGLPYDWNHINDDSAISLLSVMCKNLDNNPHRISCIIKLIREKKVDINTIDKSGNCAFVYTAILQSEENLKQILPLFLEHPSFDTDFLDALTKTSSARRTFIADKLTNLKVKMQLENTSNNLGPYAYQSQELDERYTRLIQSLQEANKDEATGTPANSKMTAPSPS